MDDIKPINLNRIYLFNDNHKIFYSVNPLKEFLNFIKMTQNRKNIEFCYSCEEDSLHQNLSVKENFILDAVPKSLIRDGEDNFKQFLLTLKNPHLKELIFFIQDLNASISSLSHEQLKLVSIVKSLLSQSEYILFLAPDKDMRPEALVIIKKAIQFEVYNRKRNVLIKAENRDLWLDISGHIIMKCESSHLFSSSVNPLFELPTKDLPNQEMIDSPLKVVA